MQVTGRDAALLKYFFSGRGIVKALAAGNRRHHRLDKRMMKSMRPQHAARQWRRLDVLQRCYSRRKSKVNSFRIGSLAHQICRAIAIVALLCAVARASLSPTARARTNVRSSAI